MSIRQSHSILLDMYTDRPSARVGLSVYSPHWAVGGFLYGIVAGFFPQKNSRFVLMIQGVFRFSSIDLWLAETDATYMLDAQE